jgi:hypothetical protein
MLKHNAAHKATQTIKDTLHTVNSTQESKTIPVTALRTGRALLHRNIIFLLLVLISVRG